MIVASQDDCLGLFTAEAVEEDASTSPISDVSFSSARHRVSQRCKISWLGSYNCVVGTHSLL